MFSIPTIQILAHSNIGLLFEDVWLSCSFKLYVSECSVASVMSNSLQSYGLWPARLLCPWDSPGRNTGVGCHAFLQEIFQIQELNPHLLHCRQIFYPWATSKALKITGRIPKVFIVIKVTETKQHYGLMKIQD